MARSREIQDLLDQFVGLKGAGQIYGMVCNDRVLSVQQARENDRHPLNAAIAGKVFELFAYDHQERALDSGRRLLTPRATLHFYSVASHKPVHETRDGMGKSIHHMSVPDGLELEELPGLRMITRLHEYKLSQDTLSIRRQMDALLDVALLRDNLRIADAGGQNRKGNALGALLQGEGSPLIAAADFELLYTAPQNSSLRGVDLPERVSVDYLPIHTESFRELVRVIMEESVNKTLPITKSQKVLS